MRRDLTEVTQAAVCSGASRDGGCIAVDCVHLHLLLLRPRDVSSVSPLFCLTMDHGPAACQVRGAEDCSGYAWGGVDATVSGCTFDVGQPQQFRVHQVPRPIVLVIAVAGGVTGQCIAAGVTGAAFISNLGRRNEKALMNAILGFLKKAVILTQTQKTTNQMTSPTLFLLPL